VHGLDQSSEMIRIARGKAEAAGATNVTFHVAAFDEGLTAFGDESLRGICAYSLLHLVDDLPSALARMFRLLEPGGFFVSSTVCLGDSSVPYRPILWLLRALGKAPTVKIFSRRALEEEVRRAGFVDIVLPEVGAKPDVTFMVAAKPL
jgi:arsenite methyltransferase